MVGQYTIRKYKQNDSTRVYMEYVLDQTTKKPHGFFKEYNDQGELKYHVEYNNGLLWNIYLIKDANNMPVDFGTFKNGTGIIKNYNENGIVSSIREYENGVLNGMSQKFYNNGTVAMEGGYYEGKRCGTWFRYNIDGTLKENGTKEFGDKCPN